MNYHGNVVVLNRECDEHYTDWRLKQWYILYNNPKNLEEYYQTISQSSIFINENRNNMNYTIPNKASIIEHISTHLV